MSKPAIRTRIPPWDRIKASVFRCAIRDTPIQKMKAAPPLIKFENVFFDYSDRAKYQRQAMELKIFQTGSMVLDSNMIHPFVRVHVVNLKTCKYLAKEDFAAPGTFNIESAQFIDRGHNKTSVDTNFFLPMSTQMCDLRIIG